MLHEDKWCKYHWQAALTLCLWIQPLAWRSCGSMLALRGPSWIKASGALAGCFWVSPLVSYAISQCRTQSGAEREQAKILVWVWHRDNAWSEHQRISEICPMEINAALLPTVKFYHRLISCLLLTLLSTWLRWWETNKIESTYKQPRYNWYTNPDNPSIWLPVSLFSCSTVSHTAETGSGERLQVWREAN